jgi:hypothetical protein
MRTIIITITSICVALAAGADLFGEVIHVPEDFETIQAAIDSASDGDTVLVAAGQYDGTITIANKRIVLYGDKGHPNRIILDGGGVPHAIVRFVGDGTDGSRLEGFTVRNGGGTSYDGAIYIEGNSNVSISNLLMYNIIGHSFNSYGGATFFDVDHATVYHTSEYPVIDAGITHFTNSIIWGFPGELTQWPNTTFFEYCDVQGGFQGAGNISSDPLFVDLEGGDFHLQADSPCIDAGDPDSPRDPDSTRADMGACYFHQQDIAVSADSLRFGEVAIDSTSVMILTITNRGASGLELSAVEIDDEAFTHNFAADTVVQPEGEYALTVSFSPREVREYAASLVITSNDPVDGEITISLWGSGVEPDAVVENQPDLPTEFSISGVHPNPFNSTATITYALPVAAPVSLRLYDLSGRQVMTLAEGSRQAGVHRTILNAADLPSGLYFIRLEAAEYLGTRKVMLIR